MLVLQAVLLRRTKSSTIDGEAVVKLPPRQQQLLCKPFTAAEQRFYDQVQQESMQKLKVLPLSGSCIARESMYFSCHAYSCLLNSQCFVESSCLLPVCYNDGMCLLSQELQCCRWTCNACLPSTATGTVQSASVSAVIAKKRHIHLFCLNRSAGYGWSWTTSCVILTMVQGRIQLLQQPHDRTTTMQAVLQAS